MNKQNSSYFMVGVFAILMMVVLFYSLYKITGNHEEVDIYYVELNNVTGLRDGSAVTYAGYEVGKVVDISPLRNGNRTKFKIEFSVKKDWPIPVGSSAQIVTPSFLSDQQLNITESDNSQLYATGSTLVGVEAVDVFKLAEQFSRQFQVFTEQGIQPIIDTVNQQITEVIPQVTEQVSQLLVQLNESANQINKVLAVLEPQKLNLIVSDTEQLVENMLRVTQRLDNSMQKIDELVQQTSDAMLSNNKDIQVAIQDLRVMMDVVSENIGSIVFNLDATTRNLQEFSRQLRNNPGVLLNSKPPEDNAE